MSDKSKGSSINTATASAADRGRIIIRTSIIGIVVNILLAGFKFVVGIISGSIAIMLDAVNNLSDALSSVRVELSLIHISEPTRPY